MHELSIAQNILKVINSSVTSDKLQLVDKVFLKLGVLSNVMIYPLQSAFNILIENSDLQQCKLIIEKIPIIISCTACNYSKPSYEFIYLCPDCGSSDISIAGGDNLEITSINLQDNL